MRIAREIEVAVAVGALAALAALAGCAPDESRFAATTGCEGTLCGKPPPGGGTVGKDGGAEGGAGGAAATVDQAGSVALLATPSFTQASAVAFNGLATITAISASGTTTSAPYGGVNGATFLLEGVESGPTWFLVEDKSGGAAGVFSTFSYQELPVVPSVTLPVVDVATLQIIASSLPTVAAAGVSSLAAHVVIFVSAGGAPRSGIKVSGGVGGGQVAYDFGAGYSDSSGATGTNGVAILFNAGLAGSSLITLTDTATSKAYSTKVQAAPGAVTLAAIAVD